jgi:hypothetical protein
MLGVNTEPVKTRSTAPRHPSSGFTTMLGDTVLKSVQQPESLP